MHWGFLYSLWRTMLFFRESFLDFCIFFFNLSQPANPRNYVPSNVPIFMNPRKLSPTKINDFTVYFSNRTIIPVEPSICQSIILALSRQMEQSRFETWFVGKLHQTGVIPVGAKSVWPTFHDWVNLTNVPGCGHFAMLDTQLLCLFCVTSFSQLSDYRICCQYFC